MNLIPEANYSIEMNTRVIPCLMVRRETGLLERVPGQPLYFEHFRSDAPRGTVIMLHGFSEVVNKLYETAFYFLSSGFHVWMFQQREHGKSYRSTDDPALINIENYNDLLLDLNSFITGKVLKDSETGKYPLYLFGHSMGGAVSACFLERYPGIFRKAILSAPMMELNSGTIPIWAARIYCKAMSLTKRGKNYLPGAAPFTGEADFENSCSNCLNRYSYWFNLQKAHSDYQMCVTSINTAQELYKLTKEVTDPRNCRRIKEKILLFQSGKDTMVNPEGQNRFLLQIGSLGKKVLLPEAKHEIYLCNNEDLEIYWNEILDFLK